MSDAVFPDPRLVDLLRSMNSAMPPWDAFRWFDTPVETLWSMMSIGPDLEVAKQDVRRVCLIFALPGSASVTISTVRSSTNRGIVLTSGQGPFVLTHQQHGPLVQIPWYAGGAGANSLTTIEVFLRAWPGGDPLG